MKNTLSPGLVMASVIALGCILYTAPRTEAQEPAPSPPVVSTPAVSAPSPVEIEEELDDIDAHVPAADPADLTRLAQMGWGEGRGVKSKAQQSGMFWCVFNRVDDPRWPDSIAEVCTQGQFHGYSPSNPVDPELYDLAHDVYVRWQKEKLGDEDVGRTLPSEYVYFGAKGGVNYFRTEYDDFSNIWDWSWPDPYEEEIS